jgi:hypothetical protein
MPLTPFSEMTPDEYRELIATVGLTQNGGAAFFGYDDRTARRWASGARPIPISVAMVLLLMRHYHLSPDDVLNVTGVIPDGR